MKDEFLTLFEAAKSLVTYIDKQSVLTRPLPEDAVVWTIIYRTPFMI